MTLHDFEIMDEMDKMDEISTNAVYLFQKTDGCYEVSLYQLHGFYIEVYLDLIKFNYKFLRVFDNINGLDDYLRKIDISELLGKNLLSGN
jgi:hypothetical protein